jgi:hypothetical protein
VPLLGFAVAVVAYNVLSLTQSAVVAAHPPERSGVELSMYYVANELRGHDAGFDGRIATRILA